MAETHITIIDEEDVDTVLAEDIDFTGNVTFTKSLMIKGKFSGTIKAGGDLYVGEKASVTATIEANRVSIKGKVKGDVYAMNRAELFSTAALEGDITAPDIIMESGCRFNGICTMKSPKEVGR